MKQHHPSPAAEALCRAQRQLIDEIYAHARRLGLSNDNLWPIPQNEINTNPYINAPDQNPGY